MRELDVRNPRTGAVDAKIKVYNQEEIRQLTATQRQAQRQWRAQGVDYRCQQLQRWKTQLQAHAGDIAAALCSDTGRRAFAHFELYKVIDFIDHWVARAPVLMAEAGEGVSAMMPSVHYTHRLVPYDLVGVISPWNVPLVLALIDSIPALLAGSAVLLKPSEITPRFAKPLMDSVAGIEGLEDVFQIVTGDAETGQAVVDHVDAICFTGSVATGRKVALHAAERFIPAFLELGGKDPAIVLPSADLDRAATAIVRSAIGMTGQACQSLERVLVHESVFDAFLGLVVEKVSLLALNWPDIGQGQVGPLIFAPQAKVLSAQLEDARQHGATIHCGGMLEDHDGGAWCQPTVITGVTPDMLLLREETFGPLIPLMSFATTEEAVASANDSEFGLSAAVFAADTAEAIAVAEQLEVGAVSINDASLTGLANDVEKNSFRYSGMGGSRMGDSGLRRFLRKRALLIQTGEPASMAIFDEGQVAG